MIGADRVPSFTRVIDYARLSIYDLRNVNSRFTFFSMYNTCLPSIQHRMSLHKRKHLQFMFLHDLTKAIFKSIKQPFSVVVQVARHALHCLYNICNRFRKRSCATPSVRSPKKDNASGSQQNRAEIGLTSIRIIERLTKYSVRLKWIGI